MSLWSLLLLQSKEEERGEDAKGFAIPEEILLKIFSYLDADTLCNVSQVCHVWHEVAEDETLWSPLCLPEWLENEECPFVAETAKGRYLAWLRDAIAIYRCQKPPKKPYTVKILMVGNDLVGKTSLVNRMAHPWGLSPRETIPVEFSVTTTELPNGNAYTLQIWDRTGTKLFCCCIHQNVGHERFATAKRYFDQTHGYMFVYDITSRDSFASLVRFIGDIRFYSETETLQGIIVGNKTDLDDQRKVSREEGEEFAKENNMLFIETSAKDLINVVGAYKRLVAAVEENVLGKQFPIEVDRYVDRYTPPSVPSVEALQRRGIHYNQAKQTKPNSSSTCLLQ